MPMPMNANNTWFRSVAVGCWRGHARFTLACIAAFAIGASTLVFAQDTSAAQEIQAGILAYKFSNYQGAAEHFQAALKLDPTSTQTRVLRANSDAQQYRPGEEAAANTESAS